MFHGLERNHDVKNVLSVNGYSGAVTQAKLQVLPAIGGRRVLDGLWVDIDPNYPRGGLRQEVASVALSTGDIKDLLVGRPWLSKKIAVPVLKTEDRPTQARQVTFTRESHVCLLVCCKREAFRVWKTMEL
jgi:hypothetical protein